MASFETVVDEYDRARPSYPEAVYDVLGDLNDLTVLDCGAGTGIATRQLLVRGAAVVAVDRGAGVLRRARSRTLALPVVVADGATLPVRAATIDVICFAQAWHWLDPGSRTVEAHRVLRPGGRWAAWWSHARADADAWFDAYWALIERTCPQAHPDQRDTDWGIEVGASGYFSLNPRITVPWTRTLSVQTWITEQSSLRYVAALQELERDQLLRSLRDIAEERFPDGTMHIAYETWLWIATKTT